MSLATLVFPANVFSQVEVCTALEKIMNRNLPNGRIDLHRNEYHLSVRTCWTCLCVYKMLGVAQCFRAGVMVMVYSWVCGGKVHWGGVSRGHVTAVTSHPSRRVIDGFRSDYGYNQCSPVVLVQAESPLSKHFYYMFGNGTCCNCHRADQVGRKLLEKHAH